ncbi:MAG: hypothetical protein IJT72_06325 [Lachnospiraceae bacterium]|nr:hypothetical protein [Lachnospiraceae bacterium]
MRIAGSGFCDVNAKASESDILQEEVNVLGIQSVEKNNYPIESGFASLYTVDFFDYKPAKK